MLVYKNIKSLVCHPQNRPRSARALCEVNQPAAPQLPLKLSASRARQTCYETTDSNQRISQFPPKAKSICRRNSTKETRRHHNASVWNGNTTLKLKVQAPNVHARDNHRPKPWRMCENRKAQWMRTHKPLPITFVAGSCCWHIRGMHTNTLLAKLKIM